MKTSLLAIVCAACLNATAQVYVTPKMGGGQVAADMVHIDIYYDADANQLHATVDISYGTPELRALEPGYAFDPLASYAVLNGKAYNAQYGWNAGGLFTIPSGAAIWVEQTNCTPGLEVYSDWGRYGAYTPIFGTGGSPTLWKWSGVMVHNTYAVLHPIPGRFFADYHIFFGDANTGSRATLEAYDDTFVRLEWTTVPWEDPLTFKFGAIGSSNSAPLAFVNAANFVTNAGFVINLSATNTGDAVRFERSIPMLALAATTQNGGPETNHACVGACLECELLSFSGKTGAQLSFWEPGQAVPSFSVATGTSNATNRFRISESSGAPDSDPYGYLAGRRFSVNEPGLYRLNFRLVDVSTNGPAHEPIHPPSANYSVYLQAGVTIDGLTCQGQLITASFGGTPGGAVYLERASSLAPSIPWVTVAGPLTCTNRIQSLTDSTASTPSAFYRLRVQ